MAELPKTLALPSLEMAPANRISPERFFRYVLTPGIISPRLAMIAGVLQMFVVFALDVLTPADIRLHVLYIFPLAGIALQCARTNQVIWGLAVSTALQLTSFVLQGMPQGPLVTDVLVALAASTLTIFLARGVRENYLETLDLATRDPLTSLHNRRSFETLLATEVARLDRYGGVFSLVMLDLDDFKGLNDSRGHQVGDRALQLLADVLREHSRQTDAIARLGGDEFAILMPSTAEVDARLRCGQLGATIAHRMSGSGFGITASLGHATFTDSPASTANALHMADEAMYAAKSRRKAST